MTKRVCRLITLILAALSVLAFGQEFKRYKGAKLDTAATEEARRMAGAEPGLEVTVYLTADPFEKVYTFYKGVGREYQVIGKRARKLPNGQELRDAFFLLDDSKDLLSSKMWVKVQRPYIGAGLSKSADPAAIRDTTAIVVSERK